MFDINADKMEFTGECAAPKITRNDRAKEDYTARLKVSFTPADEEEAVIIDEVVPGAHRLWLAGDAAKQAAEAASSTEGAAAGSVALAGVLGSVTVKPQAGEVELTIARVEGGLVCVKRKRANIVRAKFKASGRSATYEVTFDVLDMNAEDIGEMARIIDVPVTVAAEKKQATLPLSKEKAAETGDQPATKRRPRSGARARA